MLKAGETISLNYQPTALERVIVNGLLDQSTTITTATRDFTRLSRLRRYQAGPYRSTTFGTNNLYVAIIKRVLADRYIINKLSDPIEELTKRISSPVQDRIIIKEGTRKIMVSTMYIRDGKIIQPKQRHYWIHAFDSRTKRFPEKPFRMRRFSCAKTTTDLITSLALRELGKRLTIEELLP